MFSPVERGNAWCPGRDDRSQIKDIKRNTHAQTKQINNKVWLPNDRRGRRKPRFFLKGSAPRIARYKLFLSFVVGAIHHRAFETANALI